METTNQINTCLSFLIGKEYFSINVEKVLEVLQAQRITRVPNVSEDIRGVINFRGEIIPVFEMRTRFGLPERENQQKYVIIVLEISNENSSTIIGAIADKVKDVIVIDNKEIMPVPKISSKVKAEFITGIVKWNEEFILMLDVDKIFTHKELEVVTTVSV